MKHGQQMMRFICTISERTQRRLKFLRYPGSRIAIPALFAALLSYCFLNLLSVAKMSFYFLWPPPPPFKLWLVYRQPPWGVAPFPASGHALYQKKREKRGLILRIPLVIKKGGRGREAIFLIYSRPGVIIFIERTTKLLSSG